jgi:hypothetical protein
MNSIKKTVASLMAGLFVIAAIFSLILFNFDRRAFTTETYQQAFLRQGFYERLPAVLAQAMNGASIDESELPIGMRGMSAGAWEAFFEVMLPEETLAAMGNEALNSIFAYLNMESDSAQMSLQPLKRSMTGPAGVQAVYSLLNAQPDCTLLQVAQMTINLLYAEDIQFCKPPPELHPLLTPVIEAQMEVTAFVIPDEVTFASAQGISRENDPRIRLQNARTLMRLTPLLPLGLLLALTLLAVNSFKSWLDWWGFPFLITGLLASLISLGGAPLIGGLLKRFITQRADAYLPEVLMDYAGDLASAMTQAIMRPVLLQGIGLAVIGSIMMLASRYMARKSVLKNQDPSQASTIV